MTTTSNLALEPLASAQAQKHVTVNEAFARIDAAAQLTVLDRDVADPPASPADGDRYLLPASPTGAWSGRDGDIAAWDEARLGWLFLTPRPGWRLWVLDEDKLVVLTGSGWQETGGGASLNPATGGLVGVNTTADTVNRLAIKSDAALFSHDDVTPGSGDMRLTLNKALPADDTSLTMQSGFAARAQIGLTGDDDLHLKVSDDGTLFREGIVVDKATGIASLPNLPAFSSYGSTGTSVTSAGQTPITGFDLTHFNVGGHYDTATARFTAPVAGIYSMGANVRIDGAGGVFFRLYFFINGTTNYTKGHSIIGSNLSPNFHTLNITGALNLAAGDQVGTAIFSQGDAAYTIAGAESNFWGFKAA